MPHPTLAQTLVLNAAKIGCNGITPGSNNVAPAIDAAAAAGYRSAILPAHCLYIPDGNDPGGTVNVTPHDFGIIGEDPLTSMVQSNSITTAILYMGARSWMQQVNTAHLFCYSSVDVANISRTCPLIGTATNSQDIITNAQIFPGDAFVSFAGTVTYSGVTATPGNGPRGFVATHQSGDAFYAGCGTTNSDCLRTVDQGGDVQSIISLQFTNDNQPVNWACSKARGTQGTPLAVQTSDILCQTTVSGYNGTAYQQVGILAFKTIDVNGSNPIKLPGQMYVQLAGHGGGLNNAFGVDADAGSVFVGSALTVISDLSGNLQSANGVTCAAGTVSLTTLVVTKGIVTHC